MRPNEIRETAVNKTRKARPLVLGHLERISSKVFSVDGSIQKAEHLEIRVMLCFQRAHLGNVG